MKHLWTAALIAALALAGCDHDHGGAAAHDHGPAEAAAVPSTSAAAPLPPGNPVQEEMRALHEATRDWVTFVANGQLSLIPPTIPRIHAARQVTERALADGSYHPPKNGQALEDFKRQDEAFHDELVRLLQAARANDLPGASRQLGVIIQGCTSCHVKFRF